MFEKQKASGPSLPNNIAPVELCHLSEVQSAELKEGLAELLEHDDLNCRLAALIFLACWNQRICTFMLSRTILNRLIANVYDLGLTKRKSGLNGIEFKSFIVWSKRMDFEYVYEAAPGRIGPRCASLVYFKKGGEMINLMIRTFGVEYLNDQFARACELHYETQSSKTKASSHSKGLPNRPTIDNEIDNVTENSNEDEAAKYSSSRGLHPACRVAPVPKRNSGFSRGSRFSR